MGKLTDQPEQLVLLNCSGHYLPAVGVAVLPGTAAGTAQGHTEWILQNTQGSAASLRVQKQKFTSAKCLSLTSPAQPLLEDF